jgi:hypothetical protein
MWLTVTNTIVYYSPKYKDSSKMFYTADPTICFLTFIVENSYWNFDLKNATIKSENQSW